MLGCGLGDLDGLADWFSPPHAVKRMSHAAASKICIYRTCFLPPIKLYILPLRTDEILALRSVYLKSEIIDAIRAVNPIINNVNIITIYIIVQQCIGAYDYHYWKNEGYGKMFIQGTPDNGVFTCEWSKVIEITFRSGRKFGNDVFTPDQVGGISLTFAAECRSGNYFLCVYGWSVAPLVEWYIVEDYGSHKPMSHQDCLATVTIDGGTYDVYRTTRVDWPSILGIKTFEQFWSVRSSRRSSGSVDISAHFRAWENVGMKLGSLAEISFSVESWQGGGSAEVFHNVLTVGDINGS